MRRMVFGVAVAASLLSVSAARADLITNGSFESGTGAGDPYVTLGAGSHAITGWTVTGTTALASIDWIGNYWPAADGSHSLDLNGGRPGGISQTISTVAGQQYVLTFDLAANPDGGPASKTMSLLINNSLAQQFSSSMNPHDGWQEFSYSFTATGSSTTLTFSGDPATGPYGPALDKVSVNAVPEPMTLAAFGLMGLAGAGYVRRRVKGVA